ncbi:MAG: PEP-CTERM sorting domain-containing protein [bacterium]|nr:PEP-CTERM sorting domain-containing protein [bacterium]
MELSRLIGSGRILYTLTLVLVFALAGGTAQAGITQIEGSINVGGYWATQNAADLATSTIFTPYAPTAGTLYMANGLDHFSTVPDLTIATAGALDTTDGTAWGFTSTEGDWTTTTFSIVSSTTNYLELLLTGTFTPNGTGTLAGYAANGGDMRISLTQSGTSVSWGGTMNMTPEPMTMSLLGLGSLALIRRRRR